MKNGWNKVAVTILACLLVLLYGAADAFGLVPGFLTVKIYPSGQPTMSFVPFTPAPIPANASAQTAPFDFSKLKKAIEAANKTLDSENSVLSSSSARPLVSLTVRELTSETPVFSYNSKKVLPPASSTKILTAAAALLVLGKDATFKTSVYGLKKDGVQTLFLKGGGDVILAAGKGQARALGHAGLEDLAIQTVQKIRLKAGSKVELFLDNSYRVKPEYSPALSSDIRQWVAKSTSLAVDGGWDTPFASRFQTDPAENAFKVFAQHLRGHGVTVLQRGEKNSPQQAELVTSVESAPLSGIIGAMLLPSDNSIAENICHAMALRAGDPTWGAGPKLVKETLADNGFDVSQLALEDCSGISVRNRETTSILSQVMARAAGDNAEVIREILPHMSVANFDGVVAGRLPQLQGKAYLKTGTLDTVVSLTGAMQNKRGHLVGFSLAIVNVPPGLVWKARELEDEIMRQLYSA